MQPDETTAEQLQELVATDLPEVGWPAPPNPQLSMAVGPDPGGALLREMWIMWDGYGWDAADLLSSWHVQVTRNDVLVYDHPEYPVIQAGAPVVYGDGVEMRRGEYWDIRPGVYRMRVAGVHPVGGRGAWSEWSEPLEVPFPELVASPFSREELDYVNALVVVGVVPVFDRAISRGMRVSEEGVDLDRDGYTDRGWESTPYPDAVVRVVELGRIACKMGGHDLEPLFLSDREVLDQIRLEEVVPESERDAFVAVAKAYLC